MSSSQFYYLDELMSCLNRVTLNLNKCVEFWTKYSHDEEMGGFYNCLTEEGKVYDTTKYGWLQGRQVWMYCKLYSTIDRFKKDEILQAAIRGGDFLMNHFKDCSSPKVFFSTTRDGRAIKMQRTIFSEVFYCMAMAGLAAVTKKDVYKEEALSMFHNIVHWARDDPSSLGRPLLPGIEPTSTLSEPMCVLSLIHELEDSRIETPEFAEIRKWAVDSIKLHVQRDQSRVLENVSPDGKEIQGSAGRLVNPGHILECGWFLLVEAERINSKELKALAVKCFVKDPLDYGEDKEFGGLFYYLDVDNFSPTQLEWDMKLWWVHAEAMVASLMTHNLTRNAEVWEQFKRIMHFTLGHFSDEKNGEWYGYLSREGKIKMNFKGGPFKGCFHVPRALLMCELVLKELILKNY